ncbi:MAG TPA: Ku protein [Actinomycetota bacterium]|nr:Ku protein [Actinomycetota bacterium]
MPRAVWSGAISFGLVNIPVRLYPATSPRDPKFHLVDRQTGRRIRYRRVVEDAPPPSEPIEEPEDGEEPEDVEAPPAASDEPPGPDEETAEPPSGRDAPAAPTPRPGPAEREVAYSDVARGFDVGDGRHVVVEREELEALRPEPSRTIEIEHFVALAEVDPVHFEKSYHLAPADEIAEKPYALLRVAMERTGRVAVGRFVLRSREHLVLIRPTGGILGLETMYFADEVRAPQGRWPAALASVEGALSSPEIEMAERLVEALAAEWDPAAYQDPYRERVLDLIRSRAPQEAPEEVAEIEPSVADLMAVLRASVEAAKDARGAERRSPRKAGGRGGR